MWETCLSLIRSQIVTDMQLISMFRVLHPAGFIKKNCSGTILKQLFVFPEIVFLRLCTIWYCIIINVSPYFFRFNVLPSRRGKHSTSKTTLGHGTEYRTTDYPRQRWYNCWTFLVISDTGGALVWKYSFCCIAIVNMSSEDVNMLIEMGFPRNKAYVY